MKELKNEAMEALKKLEQHKNEFQLKVDEMELLCHEYEALTKKFRSENEKLLLALKQVKEKILTGKVDDAIDLLQGY